MALHRSVNAFPFDPKCFIKTIELAVIIGISFPSNVLPMRNVSRELSNTLMKA
jgi:hypothetical protein